MKPVSVDELPDFLVAEFPGVKLGCVADFARDGIAILRDGKEVAFFKESDFEQELITAELLKARIETSN